ncbi:MAG: [protein-PII] uridylyltransferase [Desulfobacteraceae bacterium]|nr:[protein-PII] uridylyltransferase [Desulfobacteraceae bacterium]
MMAKHQHDSNVKNAPDLQFKLHRKELFDSLGTLNSRAFITRHSAFLDEYFLSSFTLSKTGLELGILRNPYAIIAQGGYGRAEQCVFSDVDLLFLFKDKVPSKAESLVREILYPLWDMGLEVGHATRSIQDCLQLARQNFEVLTSLLDGRFICGMSPLYHQLMENLRTKLISSKPAHIINWLTVNNKRRHEKFGDGAYLLEPNIKEGQGGLRDYHTMLWIGRIQSGVVQSRDLEYYGYLSHDEFKTLSNSLNFVWKVRNYHHRLVGRKSDQLHLENQTKLAETMQIEDKNGNLPVEVLLGDLHGHMEYIKQCYKVFIYELEQSKRAKRKNKSKKKTCVEGLYFNRGLLNFVSPEAVLNDPQLLIQIFVESATRKTPLSAEARRLVKEFTDIIQRLEFRRSASVVEAFEKVMMRHMPRFNALSAMLDTGFLTAFIPQFKKVVNRIQFDQYHLYPIARHLLLSVRMLKQVVAGKEKGSDPLALKVYQEIRNKKVLYWATLLHDIGKSQATSGHADRGADIAQEILKEKALSETDIETAVFLIRHHLLLFETATRRDINEEETALYVARCVVKPERLKMLYLLSMADARATGPKAWNDWTASLMRSLFLRSLNAMEKGDLVSRKAIRTIEAKKNFIATSSKPYEQKTNFMVLKAMSPRYLLYTPSSEILQHIVLYKQMQDQPFVWDIAKSAGDRNRIITLCAKDRPGLLSKIAGVLTLNNINILDVHIFTWRNNVALDIFEVKAPPDIYYEKERWLKIKNDLKMALEGKLDLSKELNNKKKSYRSTKQISRQRPQQVIIDNKSSSFFTIIEVIVWDFPGLLYLITDALFRCGLDIWVAKIATRVDQAADVFYVRSFDGEKVDSAQEEEIIRNSIAKIFK